MRPASTFALFSPDLQTEVDANTQLLQEADEQFELLADELPKVEEKNKELHAELLVRLDREEELLKRIAVGQARVVEGLFTVRIFS